MENLKKSKLALKEKEIQSFCDETEICIDDLLEDVIQKETFKEEMNSKKK